MASWVVSKFMTPGCSRGVARTMALPGVSPWGYPQTRGNRPYEYHCVRESVPNGLEYSPAPSVSARRVSSLAARTGVAEGTTSGKKVHGARYTAGTEFHLATGDIYATQQLLGRADVSTTANISVRIAG